MSPSTQQRSNLVLYIFVFLFLAIGGVSAGVIKYSHSNSEGFPSLFNATIDELSQGLAGYRFTSVDLVKAYSDRIFEMNEIFHAVTELNPDASAIAAQLDLERQEGTIRGPLHGIPILLKNNIGTDDRMNTTAGSWALFKSKVARDATVAQKLRDAGAVLLGKTTLTQWANWRSSNSSNGWSALGGQVYSPYFPHGDPAGSSSGSAVASALGLAPGCLGTETDGSIISPSSYSNIVGIKPTVGLTSRHMVIPVSQHQDTVGPLARTVKDAAYILQAIVGKDFYDNYTSAIPHGNLPDYVAACNISALSGSRLGVPRNVLTLLSTHYGNVTDPVIAKFEESLKILESAGATIIDNADFTAAEEFWTSDLRSKVLHADFLVDIQNYLESLTYNPNDITSLAELREFTQSFPLEEYPERDTARWDTALEQGWNNTSPEFWSAYQQLLNFSTEGGLLGALERHGLDAMLLPTDFASEWASAIGSPVVTVPLGYYPPDMPKTSNSWGLYNPAPNVPFGISFLGARFEETRVIGLAYAFEQRTRVRDRILPFVLPKTDLADVAGRV